MPTFHGISFVTLLSLVLITSAGVALPAASVLPVSSRANENPYRLPRSVLPLQYTLYLVPDLENEKFIGRVVIDVEAQERTGTITLHAEGIQFNRVVITPRGTGSTSEKSIYGSIVYKETYEQVDLLLTEDLQVGETYLIDIEYEGTLRDNMYGFYISSYRDSEGQHKKLAATQFQPTHARKAFPCFDEPSFKARFKVSVRAPPGYHALGNMPVENALRENENFQDGLKYTFKNSMVMSSYLVAFVVSDFESKDDGEQAEVMFKSWARGNALDGTAYSLQISRPMLRVLEEYTGIPYKDDTLEFPLDKVDQVALPDFAAGAMENWGLITYRETALLYNDGSADAKKRVATVIAHELLHMWFGNLITTYWWDTTWLNEGFARYFQYYVTNEVESDWRMWDQFLVDQHQMVFALDALATAKALTHDVNTSAEVSAIFGSITYSKGGSILRMLSYVIGPTNFQSALVQYLTKHAYSNVKPQDLFAEMKSFTAAAHLSADDFDDLLRSWTEKPGFPVVTVNRIYESNRAMVSQKRFLLKGESNEHYYVPLTWTMQGRSFEIWEPEIYLTPTGAELELSGMPSRDSWVIFNVQETGYYRVNYDVINWNLISTYLKNIHRALSDIHVLNRAQLLDDSFNLARAGYLSYDVAFDMADYLVREPDYVPWSAALAALSYLNGMLVNHAEYPIFKRYVLRLLDGAYERVRHAIPARHDEKLLLNKLATWACALGHQACLSTAANFLVSYIENDFAVPADLRSVVYCYGLSATGDTYWNNLWNEYKESHDEVERNLLAAGLGCSHHEHRLIELLQYSISGYHIRKQDVPNVFSAVYSNPFGVEVALEFLIENFETISNYIISESINNIVTGIAGRLTTEDQKRKLEYFLERNQQKIGNSANIAHEILENNFEWLAIHQENVLGILEKKEWEQHRLPLWARPYDYTLWIEPDFRTNTFEGKVVIGVTADEPTDKIILHSDSIIVTSVLVLEILDERQKNIFKSYTQDEYLQFMTLYLEKPLTPGQMYSISVEYSGFLRDDMNGFYVSTYVNTDGEVKKIAATQFQPTHARKAFPCFDEPSFKSTFSVTVKAPSRYRALGNMAVQSMRVWGDFSSEAQFFTTPLMSTYLLSFFVSDFTYQEDRLSQEEVEFRTWARDNALQWADYSMRVSRPILQYLENYTGIKYIDHTLEYPLDKVDQVALPDFSAGAMENWGLVTYRETALLYNDGTAAARKSVATIIAHELAHMWFGNLVTTHWWDTTWLNEAFAQYFQYFIADKVEPDWRLMDQFVYDHHQGIMTLDALSSASPLTSPVYTPSQVSGRFNGITYSKGGAILRMVSAVIGEERFREALQLYLKEHRYGTTSPEDLFRQLVNEADSTDLDENSFEEFLRSWTEQAGFPVVAVARNYNLRVATVSQKRFLLKALLPDDTSLYFIPLSWAVQGEVISNTRPQRYLTNSESSSTIDNMPESDKWIIFNVHETGFYRVNYDATNWKLLSEHLRDHKKPLDDIHELNRAQLLDDAFNLARAGQLPYETAFYLSDYLRRETDYVPWASALAAFSYLQRMLVFNERYTHFQNYLLYLLEVQYNFFNFQDRENHIEKLLLNRISYWACSLGHQRCTRAASNALQKYLDDGKGVSADLRSIVYCYGIAYSHDGYWNKLLEKYKQSLDNAERALIMSGLACSNNEKKLEELLKYSISGEFIRKQDASNVFMSVYGNLIGVQIALDFLYDNFDEVQENYGSMGAISNIVVGISGHLTTSEQKQKMQHFLEKYKLQLGATAEAAMEAIDGNLEWLKQHEESLLDILEETVATLPTTTLRAGSLRPALVAVLLLLLAGKLL